MWHALTHVEMNHRLDGRERNRLMTKLYRAQRVARLVARRGEKIDK